jgi:hypothetical protein
MGTASIIALRFVSARDRQNGAGKRAAPRERGLPQRAADRPARSAARVDREAAAVRDEPSPIQPTFCNSTVLTYYLCCLGRH